MRQAIEEAEALFDHPLKQYMLFRDFEEQVQERRLDDLPDAFSGNRHAQAYFGIFKKVLPEALAVMDEQVQKRWVELAFEVDRQVETAVAENSINPQNIEADIRNKLLPMLFKYCKDVGAGLDKVKKMVELIVQITRVGLSNK